MIMKLSCEAYRNPSSFMRPKGLTSCLHLDKVPEVEQRSLVKCQLH